MLSIRKGWAPVSPNDLFNFFTHAGLHVRTLNKEETRPLDCSTGRFRTRLEKISDRRDQLVVWNLLQDMFIVNTRGVLFIISASI